MGERCFRLLCGQLWRIALSHGPLPTSDFPPAFAKVFVGTVGGHRGLEQSPGARLCPHQQQGWSSCPGTRLPVISRWAKRSVLEGILGSRKLYLSFQK